ncbi:aldehyde dehydrogenase family protein [Flaviflexus sp.]|uniref:aldehyde dehydrogenase family protein n=1 Tax=Flaviflexus sp. TaxID=1969482 RepID=UPI003F8F5489
MPTVRKCSDENEVDSPVNNLNFGFTGYISSGDFDWALRVCEEFYTGLVVSNQPSTASKMLLRGENRSGYGKEVGLMESGN